MIFSINCMYVWREYMYFKTCGIFHLLTNNLDSVKILSKFFGVWLFLEKLLVQIELESSIYPYNFSRILTICFYVFSLYRYFQMSWKYFRQSCCPWILLTFLYCWQECLLIFMEFLCTFYQWKCSKVLRSLCGS